MKADETKRKREILLGINPCIYGLNYHEVLFKYFPFLSWDQVIVTTRKQMIRGDVLIDDGIHNLEGGQYKKVLMTAPHNIHYDAEAHGMVRVNSWKEIEQVIDRLNAAT